MNYAIDFAPPTISMYALESTTHVHYNLSRKTGNFQQQLLALAKEAAWSHDQAVLTDDDDCICWWGKSGS